MLTKLAIGGEVIKKKKSNINNKDIKSQNSMESFSTDLPVEELTIEKMFEDYEGEPFQSKLTEFKPEGNEKW
ncbi:hypothetical protein [Vagococcus fluvialis]|uniref:hypothetical protein n=1 Tax=Vagococcus fluvialis TaxID=2738 RepID=UPI0037A9FA6F